MAAVGAFITVLACSYVATPILEETELDYVAPETTKQASVWKKISEHASNHGYKNDYVLLHQSS